MDLPLVQSPYQTSRLAQITLQESRQGITVEIVTSTKILQAQIGDTLSLTLTTPGWVAKRFSIEALSIRPDGMVQAMLMESDTNAYLLGYALFGHPQPDTNLPDPFVTPSAVTGLTLVNSNSELLIAQDGSYIPRIKANWTASDNAYLDYYEVEAQRQGTTPDVAWTAFGRPTDTTAYIAPVNYGEVWKVRVRPVTTLGVQGTWATATATVTPSYKPVARGVVEDFRDFPGSPARWSTWTGASIVNVGDPQLGGGVLRLNGGGTTTWQQKIPVNKFSLYSLRCRVRRIQASSTSTAEGFNFAFRNYNAAQQELERHKGGLNSSNLSSRLVYNYNLPVSSDWTEFVCYFGGWNGDWYYPTAAMLTNTGLGNFSGASVSDRSLSSKAWDTAAATAGANLVIDFGAGNEQQVSCVRMFLDAAVGTNTAPQYVLKYGTDGATWTALSTFTVSNFAWNESFVSGASLPNTKYRYWQLYLNNTPGAGPNVMELSLLCSTIADANAASWHDTSGQYVWNDPLVPLVMSPGSCYIAPVITISAGGGTTAYHEIDIIEMPPMAGATALL
jgi:hypothetical protein